MKEIAYFISIFFIISFSTSCTDVEISEEIIYSTSFELTADSINWQGYYTFSDDCPPDGGLKSLSVIGGCLSGSAIYNIGTFNSDQKFILTCWAKGSQFGGIVTLNYENEGITIEATNHQEEWQYYESKDTLFCPSGQELKIGIYGMGGIAGGGQLNVDLLKVIRVE